MSRNVFVLGAGASQAAGGPLLGSAHRAVPHQSSGCLSLREPLRFCREARAWPSSTSSKAGTNPRPRHSSLDYLSPIAYEKRELLLL
jgi:hypothetical protein